MIDQVHEDASARLQGSGLKARSRAQGLKPRLDSLSPWERARVRAFPGRPKGHTPWALLLAFRPELRTHFASGIEPSALPEKTPGTAESALYPSARITPLAVVSYVFLIVAVAVIGLPLLWMLLASVKSLDEINTFPPVWIPSRLRWENYVEAWNIAPFGRFYLNTIVMTFFGTLAKLFNGILSAYALSYLRFPKRDLVFLLILAALMIPPQVTILPNYLTLGSLNWLNTYQALIVPEAGIAFGTFLLRQHFLTLPREILEAARVDGAGHLRILGQIVLPLSQSIVVTLVLLTAVGRWNDYLWPLIATTTKEMRTLPVGIAFLLDQEGNTQWGQVMAATVMVVFPLLLLFVWTQRHLVEGIAAGALKG